MHLGRHIARPFLCPAPPKHVLKTERQDDDSEHVVIDRPAGLAVESELRDVGEKNHVLIRCTLSTQLIVRSERSSRDRVSTRVRTTQLFDEINSK